MKNHDQSSFDLPRSVEGDRQPVGAPSELASEAEVPAWFANLVSYFAALPLLVTAAIGLIGFSAIGCCLLLVFLSLFGQ
jgi:hypothetical protein